MCDYSLEAYQSVKAVEGETYIYDSRYTHGFMARQPSRRDGVVMACIISGQKLNLTEVKSTVGLPASCTVTVVQRKDDLAKYPHFGAFNDGIEYNGVSWPMAGSLVYAKMEVAPVEKPKAKRSLSKVLGLDKLDKVPKETKAAKTREADLVDGDD